MPHRVTQAELVMKTPNNQQGIALLVLVFFIALATIAYLVKSIDTGSIKNHRNKKTAIVLSVAKTALIGYLVDNQSKPGTLPCPDINNDGSGDTSGTNSCAGYIGRLPSKQLGLAMLEDADGECLWYAISPVFRNQMTAANRALNPINGTTLGSLTLVDNSGNALPASVNPVIAVVISPGAPVAGQNRSGAVTTYCSGDSVATKYLDIKGAVNNATGNVAGNNYTFILGNQDNTFNDRFVYIKASDIYSTLRNRMVKEILGNVSVHSGVVDYYDSYTIYPCPSASQTGNSDCTLLTGFVPYNDATLPLQYAALGSWLVDNNWFGLASYTYYSPTHVKVTVADAFGSNSCDANMNTFTCTSP